VDCLDAYVDIYLTHHTQQFALRYSLQTDEVWLLIDSITCSSDASSSAALVAQPNPIQFSICIWGNANVPQWGARVGHSWRVSGDIQSNWNSIANIIGIGAKSVSSDGFYGHGDMDMMEIGNGALTIQEQRSHFAIWAFLKSPIILGTDVRSRCVYHRVSLIFIFSPAFEVELHSTCHHHQQGAASFLARRHRLCTCQAFHTCRSGHDLSTVVLRWFVSQGCSRRDPQHRGVHIDDEL
jgi:hypothetical protein